MSHVDSVVEWCKNYGIEDIDVNNLTSLKILAIGSDKEEPHMVIQNLTSTEAQTQTCSILGI